MADINLTDVTIHIDRETDTELRDKIDTALRNINGVISVHMTEKRSHLLMVEYNPDATTSMNMLSTVRELAGHAEMIGL